MTRDEVAAIEWELAKLVKTLRAEHEAALQILRERIFHLERAVDAIETRAADPELRGTNVTWLRRGAR
jgi:hypothetical protein